MKRIIYKPKDINKETEGILIENHIDIVELQKHKEQKLEQDLTNYVKANKTHFTPATPELAGALALNDMSFADKILMKSIEAIGRLLDNDYMVCINRSGGYMPIEEKDIIKIIEEIDSIEYNNLIINKNSCKIVLENDPRIDDFTIEYFGSRDEVFSYILNLRNVMEDGKLLAMLKEFKSSIQTDPIVFVYTTGIDEQQMYEYAETCIKAGLKKFEFIFAIESESNNNFIKWLNECASVEVLKNEQCKASA